MKRFSLATVVLLAALVVLLVGSLLGPGAGGALANSQPLVLPVDNAERPFAPAEEEERGMDVVGDRFVARNPATGQIVWMRFSLGLTYVDGEFVMNTSSLESECRGPD